MLLGLFSAVVFKINDKLQRDIQDILPFRNIAWRAIIAKCQHPGCGDFFGKEALRPIDKRLWVGKGSSRMAVQAMNDNNTAIVRKKSGTMQCALKYTQCLSPSLSAEVVRHWGKPVEYHNRDPCEAPIEHQDLSSSPWTPDEYTTIHRKNSR